MPNNGTFEVPLSIYVMIETHINEVPHATSDKDAVRRQGYIKNHVLVEEILVPQNAPKLGVL